MKIVVVVGDHADPHAALAVPLGQWLAARDVHLLTGGGGGVMEAVSRAFVETPRRRGMAIGVLPAGKPGYPNRWVEIAIRTHLHGKETAEGKQGEKDDPLGFYSRNRINALTGDLLIALPGGGGTYAELRLAREAGKLTFVLLADGQTVGGRNAAQLAQERFTVVNSFASLQAEISKHL